VHGERYNETIETTNTRAFRKSVILFFSILSLRQWCSQGSEILRCTRSIWRIVVSWERNAYDLKHIWLCICLALCSRGVFSLRIALCVPQPKLFILLTSFIFHLLFIIIIIILLLIVLYFCLIFFDLYIFQYYYCFNYCYNNFIIINIIWVIIF